MSGGVRDYKPGQETFYHGDDGAVYRVRVLENNSGPDNERYFLTVLEVLQNSINESRTLEIGDQFKREKPRHIPKSLSVDSFWELLDEEKTDRRLAS